MSIAVEIAREVNTSVALGHLAFMDGVYRGRPSALSGRLKLTTNSMHQNGSRGTPPRFGPPHFTVFSFTCGQVDFQDSSGTSPLGVAAVLGNNELTRCI